MFGLILGSCLAIVEVMLVPKMASGVILGMSTSSWTPHGGPEVPSGWIWGSFWASFWHIFGSKMIPESVSTKQRCSVTYFLTHWPFSGCLFGSILVFVGVRKRFIRKKANMWLLMIVVRFHTIFKVHRGQKMTHFEKQICHETCCFSDNVLGHKMSTFGTICWFMLEPKMRPKT